MLKVKKSLAAAVLCAVASVGFVVNVYAAEEDSIKNDEKPVFALDTIIVEGQRENFSGDFVSREGNLGRLGNKDLMNVPFTQTSFSNKTVERFSNSSAALTDVLINTPSVKNSSYTL